VQQPPAILAFNKFHLLGYLAGWLTRTLANEANRLSDNFAYRIVTI
jgi:hypothetical protein